MASCCTGVTECQQIITIGFLNTFIGNDVQNSSGVAQSVAGDSDYCPTYSELTGGTLIQNWKEGTTPNGDQDGIIIGGTYAANECVRRSDLSMKYTRFKEFSISAASTTLSACSASTTISYTHKYDRCEKKLDSTCESAAAAACTAVSDTQNSEVTLTSSNNVFTIDGFKVNVPKNNPNNNGRSNARSTTITGKITFRGTNHTATVGITQNGLTGEYQYWYHTNTVHDKNVSCSGGPSFGCTGGNYSATAYYYQDDWDVYRWHDVCGTDYDSDTVQRNRVNDQYKVYDTYSGSFPNNESTGGPAASDSKSWAGYGSCSWSQAYCPPPECPNCDCDGIIWGYGTFTGTVGCTGGRVNMNNITVPGTSTTYSYNTETSACTVTTAATSTTVSTYVNVSCNQTTSQKIITGSKNNVSYSITQSAGPCCSTSRTYSYETITLNCSAHENENVRARYTATTVDSCCNTSYSYGNTDYYKVNVGCNSGSTRTLSASEKSNAPFTVKQEGNSTCCITCQCTDLTVTPTSLLWGSDDTSSKTVTISSASCVTNIAINSLTNFNATLGTNKITVSPKARNTGSTDYVNSLLVTYNDNCSSAITLTQEGYVANCDCTYITYSPEEWNQWETSAQTGVKIGTISIGGDCTTGSVTFTSNSPSVITNIRISGSNVLADLPKVDNPCTGTYKYSVNGNDCGNGDVKRMCYCGTDNCTQDGVYEHPLHIEYRKVYCEGGTMHYDTRPSSSAVKIGDTMTGDHFFIDHGQLLYDGHIPVSGETLLPSVGSDWCYGEYIYDGSGCPHINYYCTQNTGSTSSRKAVFNFTTPDSGATLNSNCLSTPWAGHMCCKSFKVEVLQSGNGKAWDKIYPATGDTYYVEIPMSSLCQATNCSDGSTLGIVSCVSSAATSTPVQIGTWSKSPAGCTQSWSFDGSRSVSGSNFINTSSIDFRSDGTIYANVSVTNSSTNTRTCQIPTKLGNTKTDYFTVTQCAGGSAPPPTPTTYTYTINSTNDNANGATVGFFYSGTLVTSSTISNRTCTVTLSTYYASLSVGIQKANCTDVTTVVGANSSASITMTCSDPNPCTLSVNVTSAILKASGGCQVIGTYSVGGSCAGQTPTATFAGEGGDFITSWTFNSTTGQIAACANYNPSHYMAVFGSYNIRVGNASQTIVLYQQANSCLTEEAPDFSETSFNHPYNSVTNYSTEFTSSCWKINSLTTTLDPPGYSFASAQHAVVGERNIITIYCNRGQRGYSFTVQANLVSLDGSGRTATKTIKVTWV